MPSKVTTALPEEDLRAHLKTVGQARIMREVALQVGVPKKSIRGQHLSSIVKITGERIFQITATCKQAHLYRWKECLAETMTVLWTWIQGFKTERFRGNQHPWSVYTTLATSSALVDLRINAGCKRLKGILRCIPPAAQVTLLRQSRGEGLQQYITGIKRLIWDPGIISHQHFCYCTWIAQKGHHYFGKGTVNRAGKQKHSTKNGYISRFQEHMAATHSKNTDQHNTYPRYRMWRKYRPHQLVTLPIYTTPTQQETLQYEKQAIQLFADKIQLRGSRSDTAKIHTGRRWPRQRPQHDADTEAALNIQHNKSRRRMQSSWWHLTTMEQLMILLPSVKARLQKAHALLHSRVLLPVMASRLMSPWRSLDWTTVWKKKSPRKYMFKLWEMIYFSDHPRKSIALKKVHTFIRTAQFIPTSIKWIVYRSHDKAQYQQFRSFKDMCFKKLTPHLDSSFLRYIYTNTRVIQGAGYKMKDLCDQHREASRAFPGLHQICITEHDKQVFQARLDVTWLPQNFDMRVSATCINTHTVYQQHMYDIFTHFRILNLWWTCQKTLHGPNITPKPACGYPVAASIFQELMAATPPGHIIVPLDKDAKRRVSASLHGHWYRMQQLFFQNSKYYVHHPTLNLQSITTVREQLIKACLRKRFWCKSTLTDRNTPRAFITYKGKCLQKETSTGNMRDITQRGLCCSRDHSHEREIIADSGHPRRHHLHMMARGLRLVARLVQGHQWTLYDPPCISDVIMSRFAALKEDSSLQGKCPCGKSCANTSAIRLDASQFFKNASTSRGLRRAELLIKQAAHQDHANSVAISRTKQARGHLHTYKGKAPRGHTVALFKDIMDALQLASKDTLFSIGNEVLERTSGWPMGGAMSEAITLIDLGHDTRKLRKQSTLQRIGWAHKNMDIDELVCGIQYVDDLTLMSKTWCTSCLKKGLTSLWPKDVGVQTEEVADNSNSWTIRFLQAQIHIHGKSSIHITPYNPNEEYCKGQHPQPHVLRLAPYLSTSETPQQVLNQFLMPQFATHNRLLLGRATHAFEPLKLLCTETWLAKWTIKAFYKSVLTLHEAKTSEYYFYLRLVASHLHVYSSWQHVEWKLLTPDIVLVQHNMQRTHTFLYKVINPTRRQHE